MGTQGIYGDLRITFKFQALISRWIPVMERDRKGGRVVECGGLENR
jgi:hypothetical protein